MVGEGASDKAKADIQKKIDGYSEQIAELTDKLGYENRYRTTLDAIRADIDATRANITAIVQRIMREHGGQVGIESQLGNGIVVTLQFPRKDRRVRMLK